MNTFAKWIGIIVVISLIVLVAGIVFNSPQSPDTKEAPSFRVVVDQVGRNVTLPNEISRIVITFPFQVPVVYALGMEDTLVGIDTRTPGYESFTRLDPSIKNIPTIGVLGGSFNKEELLRLKPDVVLCGPQDVPQMEELGLIAVATNPWAGYPDESIRVVGRALNRERRAEELVADFHRICTIAESRTGAIPTEERVRVYAVVGSPLTTYGGDQYFSSMVKTAGGMNVADSLKGSKVVVSKEQLMEWDPEMMIVLAWGAEMSSIQDILDDPALQEISAVKNKRIYSDPGYYSRWVHPDITSCLGTLTMATLMYPELFTDVNVTAEADAFDRNYFGKPYLGSIPQSGSL